MNQKNPGRDPVYKFLLCWRYLKTRYLAFACIISVTLGVATLIVVNSVMSGFSTKLRERLHALLSDVVVESYSLEGFANPAEKMERIRKHPFLGPRVEAMSATMEVFALLRYRWPNGEMITRPVRVIGIEPKSRSAIGGFAKFLENKQNRDNPSFDIPADTLRRLRDHEALDRWVRQQPPPEPAVPVVDPPAVQEPPPPMAPPHIEHIPQGAIVGHLIAHFRTRKPNPDPTDTKKF